VVNLSGSRTQARVRAPWHDLQGERVWLVDGLTNTEFERSGNEIQGEGVYIELGPWERHFFRCERRSQPAIAAAA